MCGISLIVETPDKCKTSLDEKLRTLIESRGPDCAGSYQTCVPDCQWHLTAFGSTLWTQGDSPTTQPIVTERGSFILWNGDAYNYPALSKTSDSYTVLREFERTQNPLEVLSAVIGPYAFIYFDPEMRSLWFGRDPIGRCSLVIQPSKDNLLISSVAPRDIECVEVPNHGIFRASFHRNSYELHFHPWLDATGIDISGSLPFGLTIDEPTEHKVLDRRKYPTVVEPGYEEMYSSFDKSPLQPLELLGSLSRCKEVRLAIETVLELLDDSVRRRVSIKPQWCLNCSVLAEGNCCHSKVAVLFSGGLDCTVLALLAHRHLDSSETIDLFNVAFDKASSKAADAPDRITGQVALRELRAIAPDRQWNWVEISVGEKELNENVDHIADLIHPLNSILDESLGCALWFAARGEGLLNSSHYKSPARVVLVGMGADELFGGYSRHAKAFQQSGSWVELDEMLTAEVKNIGARNLGRDNRVVSDHGRMMRVPYLDEAFVTYVNRLPPSVRCRPCKELPRGVGDKTLLRLIAHTIGLRETSVQPKRALQFGSRIANSKQKGHQTSMKLAGCVSGVK